MATITKVKSGDATLTAATADTFNLTQRWDGVEISNRGTTPIWVAWNGTTATVAGDNLDLVEAGITKQFRPAILTGNVPPFTAGNPAHILSLISSGTPEYTVIGIAGK